MNRLLIFLILFCGFLSANILAQSGRVKTTESPTPTPQKPPSRVVYSPTEIVSPFPNQKTIQTPKTEDDDVIKVDSALVPIPASVLNSNGQAVTNLRLEDFELMIDGKKAEIG